MDISHRDYTASLGKLSMTDAPGAGGRSGEPTSREGKGKRERVWEPWTSGEASRRPGLGVGFCGCRRFLLSADKEAGAQGGSTPVSGHTALWCLVPDCDLSLPMPTPPSLRSPVLLQGRDRQQDRRSSPPDSG